MSGNVRFAGGKKAWGVCSRTGQRFLLKDLVRDGETNEWVHRKFADERHPQRDPIILQDAVVLENATGDIDRVHITVQAGRLRDPFDEKKINDLTMYGQVGKVALTYEASPSPTGIACGSPAVGVPTFIYDCTVSPTGVAAGSPVVGNVVFAEKGWGVGGWGTGPWGD